MGRGRGRGAATASPLGPHGVTPGGRGFEDSAVKAYAVAQAGSPAGEPEKPKGYDAIEGKDVLSNLYLTDGEEGQYTTSDDKVPPCHASFQAAHTMIVAALTVPMKKA